MILFSTVHRRVTALLAVLAAASTAEAGVSGDEPVFSGVIAPIFEQKCVACHGPEKQKGKLRMDDYELLVKGGKEGEGLVHGKSAESNIIVRAELPEDDDEHMPPEGKKQLEAHELLLIKWWIDGGASKEAKVDDLKPGEDIKGALAKLVPAGEREKAKADAEQAAKDAAGKREAMVGEVERLRKEFPGALNFESRSGSGLVFTAVSMRKRFGDRDLAKLGPVMPSMVSLDLSSSIVTDQGVGLLKDAAELKMLRLSETGLTDAGLDAITGLSKLESLNLYGTQVTNAGILKLAGMSHLKRLYLWQSKVDANGVRELKEKLPGCEIVSGM